MRIPVLILFLLCAISAAANAQAQPDRDSLIRAWEAHVRSLPGTTMLEATGDGTYRYGDTDLPYDGALRIIGALVRTSETAGVDTGFSHLGMVDFTLPDLPEARLSSQVYYYWLTDRQTLHYSSTEQQWVGAAAYQASITEQYSGETYGAGMSFGMLSFMLNYGIWILLVALIIFVFATIGRQAKKARALLDETASINQMARENLDRAKSLQDDALAIAGESRDLQLESNKLLRKMLESLQR